MGDKISYTKSFAFNIYVLYILIMFKFLIPLHGYHMTLCTRLFWIESRGPAFHSSKIFSFKILDMFEYLNKFHLKKFRFTHLHLVPCELLYSNRSLKETILKQL